MLKRAKSFNGAMALLFENMRIMKLLYYFKWIEGHIKDGQYAGRASCTLAARGKIERPILVGRPTLPVSCRHKKKLENSEISSHD